MLSTGGGQCTVGVPFLASLVCLEGTVHPAHPDPAKSGKHSPRARPLEDVPPAVGYCGWLGEERMTQVRAIGILP